MLYFNHHLLFKWLMKNQFLKEKQFHAWLHYSFIFSHIPEIRPLYKQAVNHLKLNVNPVNLLPVFKSCYVNVIAIIKKKINLFTLSKIFSQRVIHCSQKMRCICKTEYCFHLCVSSKAELSLTAFHFFPFNFQ